MQGKEARGGREGWLGLALPWLGLAGDSCGACSILQVAAGTLSCSFTLPDVCSFFHCLPQELILKMGGRTWEIYTCDNDKITHVLAGRWGGQFRR